MATLINGQMAFTFDLSPEKAKGWAARRNARAAAKHPLFAAAGALDEIVPEETPERLMAAQKATADRMNAAAERTYAAAFAMRCELSRLVTAAELTAIDAARASRPNSSAYTADHYWTAIKSVDPERAIAWRPENRGEISVPVRSLEIFAKLERLHRERYELLRTWENAIRKDAEELWKTRYRAEHGGHVESLGWALSSYHNAKQNAIMDECRGVALDRAAVRYEGSLRALWRKIARLEARIAPADASSLRNRLAAAATVATDAAAEASRVSVGVRS